MERIIVTTHDGIFHADDVFACMVVSNYHRDCLIVRTRDQKTIENSMITIDVGGKYDGEKYFDHHQKEGAGARLNGIQYASFGLVWMAYSLPYVTSYLKKINLAMSLNDKRKISEMIDQRFIQWIDAGDTGSNQLIHGQMATVFDIINAFNPPWYDEERITPAVRLTAFHNAMEIAKTILNNEIEKCIGIVLSTDYVIGADMHMDDEIMLLEKHVPWQDIVFSSEFAERYSNLKYVIYPGSSGENTWYVVCVPTEKGGFNSRKPFPEDWAGLRDSELDSVCGIDKSVFCHNGRFICGNKTQHGALLMANRSLIS
jgi:uncharacterized UPF0160 family protein